MARGGGGRRNYVRDNSGRFSSTPGGGPARTTPAARRAKAPKRPKAGAKLVSPAARRAAAGGPPRRRGLLLQRTAVATAKRKLQGLDSAASNRSRGAQKGAVTKAKKGLEAAQKTGRVRLAPRGGVIRPGAKRQQQQQQQPAPQRQKGRQPNLAAQKAKEMANRKGTVPGRQFQDNQSRQTLSLREMRSAVRKKLRAGGIETRKDFEVAYGTKPPTTRGGWEKLYRQEVAVPQSERNRKSRPGVINGIDIQKQFRPWAVFNLDPKTATRDDVNRAFRRLALQNHPDQGGRAKDMERLKKMRDSVLANMPKPKPPKGTKGSGGNRGRKGKAAAPAAPSAPSAPQGPRLLPPAREPAAAKPKPRRTRKPKP